MSHSSYDAILSMMERDTLLYLAPEKFVTRRMELQHRKPGRELAIAASNLVVKDKRPELRCPTGTVLEIVNALRRRPSELIMTSSKLIVLSWWNI